MNQGAHFLRRTWAEEYTVSVKHGPEGAFPPRTSAWEYMRRISIPYKTVHFLPRTWAWEYSFDVKHGPECTFSM